MSHRHALPSAGLAAAACLLAVACDPGDVRDRDAALPDAGATEPPIDIGDPDEMVARIAVPQPGGFSDELWLTAFVPETHDGALPVVVLAHGQGVDDVANCRPGSGDGSGYPAKPAYGPLAQRLADEGFLVVLTSYRNAGDGAPLPGARARDHGILDARGLLAAAHWGVGRRIAGDEVALFGHSMGTYPVMWAVSEHEELRELQAGLDVRTVIQSGESGNHVANWGRVGLGLDAPTDGPLYATALLGAMLATTSVLAASMGVEEWTAEHFTDPSSPFGAALHDHLTENGRIAFGAMSVVEASNELPSCADLGGQVALCRPECWVETWTALLSPGTTSLGPPSLWISADAEAAMRRWSADRTDPRDTDNPVLAAMREGSPALAAEGPATTRRALHVLSTGDSHWDEDARAGVVQKWMELAVPNVEGLVIDDADCDHGGYLDSARACGFREIVDELHAAFTAD